MHFWREHCSFFYELDTQINSFADPSTAAGFPLYQRLADILRHGLKSQPVNSLPVRI